MRQMWQRVLIRLVLMASPLVVIPYGYAGPELTAHVGLQGGYAYPQTKLASWIEPGTALRLKLFGGARVGIPMVGAVGLGWDITYSDHEVKHATSGYYRRYTWDWFHLPVGIGWFTITPGLGWVVTDVDVNDWGLRQTSIRPAAVLNAGLRIGILPHIAFVTDVRAEKTMADRQRLYPVDENINITGDFLSGFVGVQAYF